MRNNFETLTVQQAREFARLMHNGQTRKYTNGPYFEHLEEVARLTETAIDFSKPFTSEAMIATAYLHDVLEDTEATTHEIGQRFNSTINYWVLLLSDLNTPAIGNRAKRKGMYRDKLEKAPEFVKTIKVADLISNTSSIAIHDPEFAPVYLKEKRELLEVLKGADETLLGVAWKFVEMGEALMKVSR